MGFYPPGQPPGDAPTHTLLLVLHLDGRRRSYAIAWVDDRGDWAFAASGAYARTPTLWWPLPTKQKP